MSFPVVADNAANEEFEVIGMENRNWLSKLVSDLTKASTAKQITVGGFTGWSVFLRVCSSPHFGATCVVIMVLWTNENIWLVYHVVC